MAPSPVITEDHKPPVSLPTSSPVSPSSPPLRAISPSEAVALPPLSKPATSPAHRFTPRTDDGEKQCTNCGETDTPQWRGTLCNACALWKRSRGTDRPLPLLFPIRKRPRSLTPPNEEHEQHGGGDEPGKNLVWAAALSPLPRPGDRGGGPLSLATLCMSCGQARVTVHWPGRELCGHCAHDFRQRELFNRSNTPQRGLQPYPRPRPYTLPSPLIVRGDSYPQNTVFSPREWAPESPRLPMPHTPHHATLGTGQGAHEAHSALRLSRTYGLPAHVQSMLRRAETERAGVSHQRDSTLSGTESLEPRLPQRDSGYHCSPETARHQSDETLAASCTDPVTIEEATLTRRPSPERERPGGQAHLQGGSSVLARRRSRTISSIPLPTPSSRISSRTGSPPHFSLDPAVGPGPGRAHSLGQGQSLGQGHEQIHGQARGHAQGQGQGQAQEQAQGQAQEQSLGTGRCPGLGPGPGVGPEVFWKRDAGPQFRENFERGFGISRDEFVARAKWIWDVLERAAATLESIERGEDFENTKESENVEMDEAGRRRGEAVRLSRTERVSPEVQQSQPVYYQQRN